MTRPDHGTLKELLADPTLYGDPGRSRAGGTWREALLARPHAAPRPRVVSRARELQRLLLLIGLPLALISALALFSYLGSPLDLSKLRPIPLDFGGLLPSSLAGWLHGGNFLWLIPIGLSAFLTFLGRGRKPRFLPLDW